jgi:hypothetical protein
MVKLSLKSRVMKWSVIIAKKILVLGQLTSAAMDANLLCVETVLNVGVGTSCTKPKESPHRTVKRERFNAADVENMGLKTTLTGGIAKIATMEFVLHASQLTTENLIFCK